MGNDKNKSHESLSLVEISDGEKKFLFWSRKQSQSCSLKVFLL